VAKEKKVKKEQAEQEKTDREKAQETLVTARVEEAIAEAEADVLAGKDTMTLSSGVQIKLVPLPPLLQRAVEEKFPEPEIPIVEVTVHKKKVMQPNPDDPDYQKALEQWAKDRGQALMDLAFIKGVVFELPEDETWMEELALVGVEVGEGQAARKLAYLRSVAIATIEDMMGVTGRVLAMSGVSPQAIDEAAKTVQD